MDQKNIFLESEGDAYFNRNHTQARRQDGIIDTLHNIGIIPKKVLEIGCGDGWRLNAIRQEFGSECFGVEPSAAGVAAAAEHPGLTATRGTADELPYPGGSFDLVITGFCLYLCDPKDYFKIAYQIDRVLQSPGLLVIHDFMPPFPYQNKYQHHAGIKSNKLPWVPAFAWHPAYTHLARVYGEHGTPLTFAADERLATDFLRKDVATAFPSAPFPDSR